MKNQLCRKMLIGLYMLSCLALTCHAVPPKKKPNYTHQTQTIYSYPTELVPENNTADDNAMFELLSEEAAKTIKKEFPDAKPNIFTPKQEGLCWCWAACFEGLAKYHGFPCHQEFFVRRINGTVTHNPNKMKRCEAWTISGIPPGETTVRSPLALKKADIFDLPLSRSKGFIKYCILDYYNKIEKNPFAILDSSYIEKVTPLRIVGHLVNVIRISDDNKMEIEDPSSGLSYTKNINTFCEGYYKAGYPTVELVSLIPSDTKVPRMVRYFPDIPDSCENITYPGDND